MDFLTRPRKRFSKLRAVKKLSLSCASFLLLLSLSPTSAQTVTFESYPKDAAVNVSSSAPGGGLTPVGPANQPLDLSSRYEQSVLKIVITAKGRRDWSQSFTKGELKDGVYGERIYLHPTNPLMYLVDFPLAYPGLFCILSLFLLSTGTYYYRVESGKRKVRQRENTLLSLGKEYEKDHGDYLLIKDLGQGAFGVVRLGVRKDRLSQDGLVAIKTMFLNKSTPQSPDASSKAAEEDDVSRFRREAKILQKANHPNILRIYEWGERESEHYIVMELLEGSDLKDYLQDHPRPELVEVREMFYQISSALEYLHKEDVFHRDLKPANIHRSHDGQVKLIDFGLAASADQTRKLTQEGAIMGTLDYMAPEHFLGTKQDAFYDQFALGAILFELLTGRLPHDEPPKGADFNTLLLLYLAPRRSLKEFRPDLSPELCDAIDKMLAKEPKDRFESVKAAFEAFDLALAREPMSRSLNQA